MNSLPSYGEVNSSADKSGVLTTTERLRGFACRSTAGSIDLVPGLQPEIKGLGRNTARIGLPPLCFVVIEL